MENRKQHPVNLTEVNGSESKVKRGKEVKIEADFARKESESDTEMSRLRNRKKTTG